MFIRAVIAVFYASTMLFVAVGGVNTYGQAPINIEMMELKTSLDASAKRIQELESQVTAQRSQTAALMANLASANAQTGNAREQYERLRSVVEGLGVGALSGSSDEIQARLLAALSDLRLKDEKQKTLTEALISLNEAVLVYLKSTAPTDTVATELLKSKLDAAGHVINTSRRDEATQTRVEDLHNAQVVSTKSDGGIAVFNVGTRDGIRVGMPFQVFRGDKAIARALVVDVRKNVCGAIVQELMGADDAVKTGDRGEVDPTRTF